jgi:WD40 repeat protein
MQRSVADSKSKEIKYKLKAHAGEITNIAVHEGPSTFISTSSRDRTVQVFLKDNDSWDLLQTLDEHVSAVTSVLFSPTGSKLISISADRTVVVRETVNREIDGKMETAFIVMRVITLKAAPVAMYLDPQQDDILLVSTIDRQIHRCDLETGQTISSFKVSDSDGGDAVVLSSLICIPSQKGNPLLAGLSSTDKSVRLYDDGGYLLKRDWGHTEGVTDITFVSVGSKEDEVDNQYLVTVATDGTIFMWDVNPKAKQIQDLTRSMELMGSSTPTNSIVNKPPLRRVLSQSELARFQRRASIDDSSTPVGSRSPRLRKRSSKFSLATAPRLEPSAQISSPNGASPVSTTSNSQAPTRKYYRNRSPSPPSPRSKEAFSSVSKHRRPSLDVRNRTKSSTSLHEFGSIGSSTESVCRTLRAYRKKLANTTDTLTETSVRELEKELALTARAVGEKAVKAKAVDENLMVKLLDQFSERLVGMLDERLEEKIKGVGLGVSGANTPVEEFADFRKNSEVTSLASESIKEGVGEGSSNTSKEDVTIVESESIPLMHNEAAFSRLSVAEQTVHEEPGEHEDEPASQDGPANQEEEKQVIEVETVEADQEQPMKEHMNVEAVDSSTAEKVTALTPDSANENERLATDREKESSTGITHGSGVVQSGSKGSGKASLRGNNKGKGVTRSLAKIWRV